MINLDSNWKLYRSPDSKYVGYFRIDTAPSGWISEDVYYVKSSDFLDYFYLIDADLRNSIQQTYDHFNRLAKNSNLELKIEDIILSEETVMNWFRAALDNDINEYVSTYGEEYEDWQHFQDLVYILMEQGDYPVYIYCENPNIIKLICDKLRLKQYEDIYDFDLNQLKDLVEKL